MPRAKQFNEIFTVDLEKDQINFSPRLFFLISQYDKAIAKKRIDYDDTGISKEYYLKFKNIVLEYTKRYARELRKLSVHHDRRCLCANLGYIDFNTLDHLEGCLKSACDNGVVSWGYLGYKDKNHFDETILAIKELIESSSDNYLFMIDAPDGMADILPYFEFPEFIDETNDNVINEEFSTDNNYIARRISQIVPCELLDDCLLGNLADIVNMSTESLSLPLPMMIAEPLEPTNNKRAQWMDQEIIRAEYIDKLSTIKNYSVEEIIDCASL